MDIQTISYSKLNYTNIYLSYIIFGITIFIFFKLYAKIIIKVNKNKYISPDFRYIFMGSNTVFDTISNIFNLFLFKKLEAINYELNEDSNSIKELYNKSDNYNMRLIQTNADMILDLQNSYINTVSTMQNINNSIKKTNKMHLANIEAMNKTYNLYSTRITTYVKGLIQTMSNLQYQLNIAYITPTLTKLIDPIQKLYNSIYDTLTNNSNFIKKYTKNLDFNSIKPIKLKVDLPETLKSDFEKSQEIFDKLGY